MPTDIVAGLTVADVARRYRVGEDKVRGWIRRGELSAINTADRRCGRPRFVITAESLAAFERGRAAAEPPKPPRRKKRTVEIDFYPD
jgi:transposase